jgi:hypothetical protein
MFGRDRGERQVEALLRGASTPRPEFVSGLVSQISPPTRARRRQPLVVLLAAALLAVAAAAMSASIGHAGTNADNDPYRPGFGFGDPNHNHTGPPGLAAGNGASNKKGDNGTPLSTRDVGQTSFVSTSLKVDEQAHLTISVLDSSDQKILISQAKSIVGKALDDTLPQTKNVQYLVLVPRTLPITLAIPANLLTTGDKYFIRVIARDNTGKKSPVLIPFIA